MGVCQIALLLKQHPCMVYLLYPLAHKPRSDHKFRNNRTFTVLVRAIKLDWSCMWLRSTCVSVLRVLARYLSRFWDKSPSGNDLSNAGHKNVWLNCCIFAGRPYCNRWTPFYHECCQGEKWQVTRIILKIRWFKPETSMHFYNVGVFLLSLYLLKSFDFLHRYRNVNIQFSATRLWFSKLHATAWSQF